MAYPGLFANVSADLSADRVPAGLMGDEYEFTETYPG